MTYDVDTAKNRIGQVFRYLAEMHRVRTPPILSLADREWCLALDGLPRSSYVQSDYNLGRKGDPRATADPRGGAILKVGRPRESDCPEPSVVIRNWLKPGWDAVDADVEAIVKKRFKGQAFAESDERVDALDEWLEQKRAWESGERSVVQALGVFSDLFELRSRFDRESEKYQLFLADGMLVVDDNGTRINHPILIQRVELLFNPSVPEFYIVETDDNPEAYVPLLRHASLDGGAIQQVSEAIAGENCHPLGGESTSAFFKDFIHRYWTDGEFIEDRSEIPNASGPHIYRRPHLFLGNRNQGLDENIERYLEALPHMREFPESLLRIVGIESGNGTARVDAETGEPAAVDLLLTKPANPEQEQVIRRVEETGAVLVQGPPGTGKSHTIANLIGHFLAQDKSILVTSHASKALRVVRDQLAKPLQPLCVSVLRSDDESNKQLEESISGIINYLASTREKKLSGEIEKITEKRAALQTRRDELWNDLLNAVAGEYAPVDVLGESLTPSEAARKLGEGEAEHTWIPAPLDEGFELPLTADEVAELYALNAKVSPEDEPLLGGELPPLESFPTPKEFAGLFDDLAALEKMPLDEGREFWRHDEQRPEELAEFLDQMKSAVQSLDSDDEWVVDCLEAGRKGGKHRKAWLELATLIDETCEEIVEREPLILKYGPQVPDDIALDHAVLTSHAIVRHLESGKKLGRLSTIIKPKWRELIESTSVESGRPRSLNHFRAIRELLTIRMRRNTLVQRWDRQMAGLDAPGADELGRRPERKLRKYAAEIRDRLQWHPEVWSACEERIQALGLKWDKFGRAMAAHLDAESGLGRRRELVETQLGGLIDTRQRYLAYKQLSDDRQSWLSCLDGFSRKDPVYPLIGQLRKSIKKSNYDAYCDAWQRLSELHELKPQFERRGDLLERLDAAAAPWASAIRERKAPHDEGQLPGDLDAALRYRRWEQRLDQQSKLDIDKLQEQLDSVTESLLQASASYVEKRAWLAQLKRTGLDQQQALTGWLGLHKKIGKGKGKHVARLKQEAKNKLVQCRSAVPVWIMPLSRVTECFDLATTRFDVVIIDEASQSDPLGLLAFALGRAVVVVGDHEQVSPYAVGQSTERVNALIDETLTDVPNKELYDGKTSVYDLARQSFGGTIRLLEHYRCVPDIIQFSNQLCYGGEIQPLREASASRVFPALVEHRARNGKETNGVNRNEALEIAALVSAVCKLDEYKDCTIGVICMVGTEQALYIDSVLKKRLTISEYQQRRILCGNASQFQGDERDIIFLSIVNSPADGPLHLRQRDDARKVFNVAASRARDQLWVVHSLTPSRDLKAGDLRQRLIAHAENPSVLRPKVDDGRKTFRSELEREVFLELRDAGYRIVQQYMVGECVIDLVVEDDEGRRVAIQCDGDREQTSDGVTDEMARNQMLRRLGWTFIRVRGSEFFRDRGKAMKKMQRRLQALGIAPVADASDEAAANDAKKGDEPLHKRVIKRAALIRKRWKDIPTPSAVRKAAAAGRRGRKVA